jgi:hypothetical protein
MGRLVRKWLDIAVSWRRGDQVARRLRHCCRPPGEPGPGRTCAPRSRQSGRGPGGRYPATPTSRWPCRRALLPPGSSTAAPDRQGLGMAAHSSPTEGPPSAGPGRNRRRSPLPSGATTASGASAARPGTGKEQMQPGGDQPYHCSDHVPPVPWRQRPYIGGGEHEPTNSDDDKQPTQLSPKPPPNETYAWLLPSGNRSDPGSTVRPCPARSAA